ncbi:hypothetical protein ACO2Q9_15120 [Variovorax sp. VNK109]|jgi:hypothetical protein|uniref:MuF-C-terminal domain-containing protein n=1 Tax=Variovorax sp. VNK109 TaxID=3400919 RepID=UPI003BFC5402
MPSAFQTAVKLILAAANTDQPHHEAVLNIGATPEYLRKHAAFPELDLIVTGKTIDKVHFEHGITRSQLARLPALLEAPKALYRSDTVGGAIVVTFELKNSNPIIIAVHPAKLVGRQRFNVIASIYDKPAEITLRWQQKGLLLWKSPTQ